MDGLVVVVRGSFGLGEGIPTAAKWLGISVHCDIQWGHVPEVAHAVGLHTLSVICGFSQLLSLSLI